MALNLNHLNARQRDAVLYANGPLLILAGAGSGKTSTMAYRIAHLISERKVSAEAILGLSFTNKAAGELKERVRRLVIETSGKSAIRGLTITTFHSLCARILRAYADRLGFQNNFTILDQNDQRDVLRQVLRNIRIDDRKFDPDVILFEIGQAKNRFLGRAEAETYFLESKKLSPDYAVAAASAWGGYQDQLRILNSMDFDDLIFHTVHLLTTDREIRDICNFKFKYILVDEYQDTNPAQFKILKLLTERQQNLCVVGDDDQSIYAWRGADPAHILGFKKDFPTAHVIALEQNYRSTMKILNAANGVIAQNKNRFPKKLWSSRGEGEPILEVVVEEDRAEADYVAEEIHRRVQEQGKLWKDFAVLYRSNAQSRVFEEACRRKAIPYKMVGGLSFLARKEVKDVLSYWRLVSNSKDDAALRRILNWPTRGIGRTSIESLSNEAFAKGLSLFEVLNEAPRLAPKTAASIFQFRDLILHLHHRLEGSALTSEALVNWARESLESIQAKKAIEEESDDPVQAARKWENVEELLHSIGQFPLEDCKTSVEFLREFLNRMTLESQETEKDQEEKNEAQKNQVTLLTLHGAKGRLFTSQTDDCRSNRLWRRASFMLCRDDQSKRSFSVDSG
jgi:DNA helicase-2/ATP-dependent DNA helicase PcrA